MIFAVQGTFKSIFHHHSLKASVLHCSTCFMVQLSYPYVTTGKTIALTIQTIVDKVMTLLLNTLSRFVIGFPGGSDSKESACHVEDLDSIPGFEISPGARHDNPLQYSCLENPHEQGSPVGYSPWGHKESDTTERPSFLSEVEMGFPGGTGDKELACQCRRRKRLRFDPWVGKIPWYNTRQLPYLKNPTD